MGVPKYFRWIRYISTDHSERYPLCCQLIEKNRIPEYDNLYLDVNGIIHNSSQAVLSDETIAEQDREERIFEAIFNYIQLLYDLIRPKVLFYVAIDGVAPRAKMNQQRSRRFRAGRELEEKRKTNPNAFDSNCITPGTKFMERLSLALGHFLKRQVSFNRAWQTVKIVFSGHETPGEGEHKIMDHIRDICAQPNYDGSARHCLYGLDADLIMLSLVSHEPYFALLREEVVFGKKTLGDSKFYLLHITILREYLKLEFDGLDVERAIDDYVLMMFLVGNDFLPNLPGFDIKQGSIDVMINGYKQHMLQNNLYLQRNGVLDLEALQKFLKIMEPLESTLFCGEFYEQDVHCQLEIFLSSKDLEMEVDVQNKEVFVNIAKCLDLEMEFGKRIILKKTKKVDFQITEATRVSREQYNLITQLVIFLFDSKAKETVLEVNDAQFAIQVLNTLNLQFHHQFSFFTIKRPVSIEFCRQKLLMFLIEEDSCYLSKKEYYFKADVQYQSLEFKNMLQQYVNGLQWTLSYYYHGLASWSWFYPYHYAPFLSDVVKMHKFDIKFDKDCPFAPFEQLLAVLPCASKHLLPLSLQELMEPSSQIFDFYPLEFEQDLNGKTNDWEAVVKIPFIETKRLLDAMDQKIINSDDKKRNRFQKAKLYYFDPNSSNDYPSPERFLFQLKNSNCVEEIYQNQVFLSFNSSAFPSLFHLEFSFSLENLKVKVFGMPSNNKTMCIKLQQRVLDARDYIQSLVFIDYPYLLPACLTAIYQQGKLYTVDGEQKLEKQQRNEIQQEIAAYKKHSSQRFALLFDCNTFAKVSKFEKMVRLSDGSLTRVFSETGCWIPMDCICLDPELISSSFEEEPRVNFEKMFPLHEPCFYLGKALFGCMGHPIAVKKKCLDVVFNAPSDSKEWKYGLEVADIFFKSLDFKPVKQVFESLNLQEKDGWKVLGSLFVKRKQVGLQMLDVEQKRKCYGLTHFDKEWFISREGREILVEYLDFSLKEMVNEASKYVSNLNFTLVDLNYESIPSELVLKLEQKINLHEFESVIKTQVSNVPYQKLLSPEYIPELPNNIKLGDRVCYVLKGGNAPLGARGYVIGLDNLNCEVRFDSRFPFGSSLGKCSPFHGAIVKKHHLLNISQEIQKQEKYFDLYNALKNLKTPESQISSFLNK